MMRLLPNPAEAVRRRLALAVHAVFHQSPDEPRVFRSNNSLIAPDSVAWRVHGDVTTMMAGGIAALLLQMLHPVALAGVWDHSDFEADMLGRLRRTARFIAITTYADRADGEAIIDRVNRIHDRVGGVLPDGTDYRAGDPATLAFVHVASAICFLDAYIRFAEPRMSRADQDRYFGEVAWIARALGADPVPIDRATADALLNSYRPMLRADERTAHIRRLIVSPAAGPAPPVQAMIIQSAIDLLPAWARSMHGLAPSRLSRPAVNVGTVTLSRALRWALAG